jgi:hypothetical protein
MPQLSQFDSSLNHVAKLQLFSERQSFLAIIFQKDREKPSEFDG